MESDQLSNRIRQIIGSGSERSFAQKAGISDSTLRSILAGSKPTYEKLVALARAGSVSVDWLATGEEASPSAVGDKHTAPTELLESVGLAGEFVLVPRFEAHASAGPGAFTDSALIKDRMAFQERFLRRTLGIDPKNAVLTEALGDSMEPTIRDGDLLLVDTGVNEFIDDAIYVIFKGGHLAVKRIQRFLDGAVSVKSDNALYVEETLGREEAADVVVAGRVRWIGRLT